MTYLRTFFGQMKDIHDWRYCIDSNFNFRGGLIPALNDIFNQRRKKLGTIYGTAQNVTVLKTVNTTAELDLSVFNKNDPLQHMQKVMVGFGSY